MRAGVGKTAIVRCFCDGLDGSAATLHGGCDPLLTPRPPGPFLELTDTAPQPLAEAIRAGVYSGMNPLMHPFNKG